MSPHYSALYIGVKVCDHKSYQHSSDSKTRSRSSPNQTIALMNVVWESDSDLPDDRDLPNDYGSSRYEDSDLESLPEDPLQSDWSDLSTPTSANGGEPDPTYDDSASDDAANLSSYMEESSADSDSSMTCVESDDSVTKPASRRRGRARATQGSSADTARNAQRRRRYQQKLREDQLEKDSRSAVFQKNDKLAEKLYQELLPTVRGRHLFPSQTKTVGELKAMQKLGENFKSMQKDMPARSKHRAAIAHRVARGLPPSVCKEILGLKPSYLRKVRQRELVNSNPALVTEHRDEGSGRVRWSAVYTDQIKSFFESRTEILSGAKTHTRRLLMTKGRLEAEFYAHYPALLRRVAELEPSVRDDIKATQYMTVLQKSVLAAENAAQQPNFSEAEEYKSRLDAELQRYCRVVFT